MSEQDIPGYDFGEESIPDAPISTEEFDYLKQSAKFLANSNHTDEAVEKMYHAWFKFVTLQVTFWSYPRVLGDDW
jgi:hypothetical protein